MRLFMLSAGVSLAANPHPGTFDVIYHKIAKKHLLFLIFCRILDKKYL